MIPQLKDNDKLFKIHKYPDRTSYVELLETQSDFLEFTFRINTYEDLWHLGQLLQVITFNRKQAVVTIPCLLDGQADRRFDEYQTSGLVMVVDFLNEMNSNINSIGYKVFHPHNPEVFEALCSCGEIIDNSEFIIQVLNALGIYGEREAMGLTIMSSDAGGFKPMMKLADKIHWNGDVYFAGKSRKWDYESEKSILAQVVNKDDFEGQDILIIDDICIYGGTFKGLAKLLRERNVGKLYLAVSHMTIQNHKGKDTVFSYFDRVFTSNSKYDHYWVETFGGQPKQPDNLEVIKLF